MTADENLADAARTVQNLSTIKFEAFVQNGPTLIADAMLRVALADAVTNRIRLLTELVDRLTPATSEKQYLTREPIAVELQALIDQITTPAKETP